MQADEDVGKIALAVPLLVSKALELFLQDLCDRTYEVTLQKGAKTVNCMHLKQCVQMYSSYDFLTDVVNKVPTLGGSEPCGDDKGISRRRKIPIPDGAAEENDELRSPKMATRAPNLSTRGRGGRGRGRGRGRPPLNRNMETEKEQTSTYMKSEDEHDTSPEHMEEEPGSSLVEKVNITQNAANPPPVIIEESRKEEQTQTSTWPLHENEAANMGIDPTRFVNLNMHIDEDEDYDNED